MPRHFFFDLDNTLTRSKQHIEPSHAEILEKLTKHADVVVVSGHDEGSIKDHLGEGLKSHYYILSQNGNHAEDRAGAVLWEHKLSPAQVEAIHTFIAKARAKLALQVRDENDLIDDRGCEVAYSLIGHHENIETKEAFDPKSEKRMRLLADMQDDAGKLGKEANVEVRVGGTTVLDFMEKGKNKGYNIAEFIKRFKWDANDCVYVGDALFHGGNDETVMGIIPIKAVKDYRETYSYLQELLVSS